MKNFTLLAALLLFAIGSFAQKITRGPDVGEIYFLGPTHTGTGLYYSTDFGETAVCVDSTMDILTIAGDKTSGGVYCIEMPSNLNYSDNYGNANSWEVKNGGISVEIESGINPGNIFSSFYMHSEDFGSNFVYHTCNGYFGNKKNFTIDNIKENIGYVLSNKLTVADSVYFFRTYDTFENLELIHTFNYHWSESIELIRGFNLGELYFFNLSRNELWFSSNYAEGLTLLNKYNFINCYQISSDGGQQEGEFFILYNFVNLMWQNAHIYIYHSTDYGATFEVYHPFAKGNEPILTNFSAKDKEVHLNTPVEFHNFSIGDIVEYQWDFENDGKVDSYEESPVHIYEDIGHYSVKLSSVGLDSTNSFIKQNYIHIIDTTTSIKEEVFSGIAVYPNPINNELLLNIDKRSTVDKISVFNLQGKRVIEQTVKQNKTIKLSFSNFPSGIYFVNITGGKQSTNYKIIKN
jgi:PKD repeat protein